MVLTGTEADRAVLGWARLVARAAPSEHVEMLILDAEPADWVPEFPPVNGYEPWKERVRDTAEEVAAVFEELPDVSLHTRTGVGAPLPTILQNLLDGHCDLVVIGVADEDDRRLAEKLARKSPVSVLSVPAAARAVCDSIVVPVDFSEPSALALEVAGAFAKAFDANPIRCFHAFRVSGRSTATGLPRQSLSEAYRQSATDHLTQFLATRGASLPRLEPAVCEAAVPSAAILEELAKRPADLLVMATRGRSSIACALLGSNTAEVIRRAPIPILAVKAKGEGLAFLRTLLGQHEHAPAEPAVSA